MTTITLRDDLDAITLILNETFRVEPFKRDYDQAFGRIADRATCAFGSSCACRSSLTAYHRISGALMTRHL
jgi:hypothetical protein